MKEGRIIKALSGFYYVQSNSTVYACKGRGVFRNKNITPLVGDFVSFDITDEDEGYITKIHPRKNELKRPPIANVTQAIIVNAASNPSFSSLLLDRFLVLVESNRIKPIILITKKDLATLQDIEQIKRYIKNYERLGYQVTFISLETANKLDKIEKHFEDEVTVLIGQSGVGKSSLLNTINPSFKIETNEISTRLGRGKHTTRHVELLQVNNGLVADTPGFSSLDFNAIEAEDLSNYFIEMKALKVQCKFRRCFHHKEPQCAVKQAVETGEIKQYRYDHYLQFLQEILERKPRYSND